MTDFISFSGIITMIDDFWIGTNDNGGGCYKLFTLENEEGTIANFVVEPSTYFVDHATVHMGDTMIGFYDANVPVPLIYPPQYRAVVMAVASQDRHVKVGFFDNNLVSSDGQLRLNLSPQTLILLENGQHFSGDLSNRNLIVSYGASTKSIPAQTTPYQIIVMC